MGDGQVKKKEWWGGIHTERLAKWPKKDQDWETSSSLNKECYTDPYCLPKASEWDRGFRAWDFNHITSTLNTNANAK